MLLLWFALQGEDISISAQTERRSNCAGEKTVLTVTASPAVAFVAGGCFVAIPLALQPRTRNDALAADDVALTARAQRSKRRQRHDVADELRRKPSAKAKLASLG